VVDTARKEKKEGREKYPTPHLTPTFTHVKHYQTAGGKVKTGSGVGHVGSKAKGLSF
jgi:hypothetical protein